MLLETMYIKTKNFDIKPNKGGNPAKDSNNKTKNVVINGKFPKNFNSFNVFKYFISNKKKIKKILINIKI